MRVCQNFDAAAIRCNNSPESDVRRSCARFAKADPLSGDGGDAVLSGRAKHGPVPATRRSVGRRGAALRRPSPARARIAMGKAEKTEYAAAGPVFPAYREQYFAALFAVWATSRPFAQAARLPNGHLERFTARRFGMKFHVAAPHSPQSHGPLPRASERTDGRHCNDGSRHLVRGCLAGAISTRFGDGIPVKFA